MHSSDEILLAHLDGELGERQERRIARHLKACWECRARLAELEAQVEALAKAQSERSFPGKARIEAARARFLEWEERFEEERPRERFSPALWRNALRAAAVLAVIAAGLAYWETGRRSRRQTEALLRQSQIAEQAFASSREVVHQVLRVEVAQIRPGRTERRSRLEVWSEASSGRLAFHWNDQEGKLKEAVLREAAPKPMPRPIAATQAVSLGDLSQHGLDPDRIEDGFLAWLKSRQWLPVGVTTDLAVFRSRGGVVLTAERTTSGDGQNVIRFHARGRSYGADVAWAVEVDAASFRVRWQHARYETPERAVELRLISERAELISAAGVRPGVFSPPSLAPEKPRPPVIVERKRPAGPVRSGSEESAELDAVEVEALWLLHRIGACTGEVTEVASDPPMTLRIRALVRTEERKSELVAALAVLPARANVVLDVHTFDEAPAGGTSTDRHSPTASRRTTLSLEKAFVRYLIERAGIRDRALAERQARELAQAGQSASGAAYVEGWALVRLAERFDPNRIAKLPPRARRMLEQMVRQHGAALRSRLEETRETLAPLLVAGAAPPEPLPPAAGWTEATFALFDAVARLDDLVQDATGDALAGPEFPHLFSGLAPLIRAAETGLTQFDIAVASQFTAGRDLVSGSTEPR
jgi:hypothetical protein